MKGHKLHETKRSDAFSFPDEYGQVIFEQRISDQSDSPKVCVNLYLKKAKILSHKESYPRNEGKEPRLREVSVDW